jgi:hypothetical protein
LSRSAETQIQELHRRRHCPTTTSTDASPHITSTTTTIDAAASAATPTTPTRPTHSDTI